VFVHKAGVGVVAQAGSSTWQEATVGTTLEPGDAIKAGSNSHAVITFFDGSTVELESNTEVKVSELGITDEGSTTIKLEQVIGTTVSRVQKLTDPASSYEVEAPACVAVVRGSVLKVVVSPSGKTTIYNLGGTIYAIYKGKEIPIPEGSSLTFGGSTGGGGGGHRSEPDTEKTFLLSVDGCEPENTTYEISLDGQNYFTMTGNPLSYTFSNLVVGQSYNYYVRANGSVILSGTTESLTQGSNINSLAYEWPCADKTFNLSISGCEPENSTYEISLDSQDYFTIAGNPLSYTFNDLVVGETYDYSVKANGMVILAGTTEELAEGSNTNDISYEWPCASKTFELTVTGCEPEDTTYEVSLDGENYYPLSGDPLSHTFTNLVVGETYDYSVRANGVVILAGTTEELAEGSNVNDISYEWPCASKTFELTVTGCEPEDTTYEISLDDQNYFTMTGDPLSYTFSNLVVGQSYDYYVKANGMVILSGTTENLTEGTNINSLAYQWPCGERFPVINIQIDTGMGAEIYIWDRNINDWATDEDTGKLVDGTNQTTPDHIGVAKNHCYTVWTMKGEIKFKVKNYPSGWTVSPDGYEAQGCVDEQGVYSVHFTTK
jgi:hypothetical protein